jgi:hypothetical protein
VVVVVVVVEEGERRDIERQNYSLFGSLSLI